METTFFVHAVLFEIDGTLTDSIAAVEAAWGKVALAIDQDPAYIISATHGKHAIDNLAQFKPQIQAHEMDATVQAFEESILFFADAYAKHGLETTLKDDADQWYGDGLTKPRAPTKLWNKRLAARVHPACMPRS